MTEAAAALMAQYVSMACAPSEEREAAEAALRVEMENMARRITEQAPLKNVPARPLFAPGLDRSYAHEKFPDSRPYDLYTKLYSEICGLQLCSKKISAVGGYQVRKKERGKRGS